MALKDFHHPFVPYNIQQQLMEAVYECIETGQVGIFESPTGTGKSLSLICGSLTWLREHKRRLFDDAVAAVEVEHDEPDWMIEHAKEARRKEARQMRDAFETRLQAVRDREKKIRERHSNGEPPFKKRKQASEQPRSSDADEEHFVLDDYDSDDDTQRQCNGNNDYSSETTRLLQKLGMLRSDNENPLNEEDHDELKIYFCSRTHSQLSQFVGELQRVHLPPGLPPDPDEGDPNEELKHLSLGSRKNLCINPQVKKLVNPTAINERCMELQQSNTPADHKCPFLPNKDNEDVTLDFRDHALAKIRDIEDLAAVGKKLGICPYYASRPAIGPAEMVTLPYPLLLQKSARDALGISLKGHVVLIDEAHNLIDAIEDIYSVQITEAQLKRSRESLMVYLQRFRNRLKGGNRVYVTQVVRVIDSLLLYSAGLRNMNAVGGTLEPGELLSGKAVDQVNLSKLARYINESKLARKVEGYSAHVAEFEGKKEKRQQLDVPTLTQVQAFLTSLTNPSKEGKFFWHKEADEFVLRYLLLDPSEHFREVVQDARAVILVGGTMSPMESFKQQLFPYLPSMKTLSCGHLIPRSNLLVRTISHDADGPLDFSFKARSNSTTFARVGRIVLELAPYVRAGLVIFFPSYGFLEQVMAYWQQESMLNNIQKIKPVYSDSRTGVSAEDTFKSYAEAVKISPRQGAILLSVIGGKLSEGINFADDLGRCVLVVGLPFPNLESPEWKAKMQYIDDKAVARGEPKSKASREHAENVCMRSVNQAIGRVIRHKDDWAGILLMDSRYVQDRIKDKLPGWIRECLPKGSTHANEVKEDVGSFFKTKAD